MTTEPPRITTPASVLGHNADVLIAHLKVSDPSAARASLARAARNDVTLLRSLGERTPERDHVIIQDWARHLDTPHEDNRELLTAMFTRRAEVERGWPMVVLEQCALARTLPGDALPAAGDRLCLYAAAHAELEDALAALRAIEGDTTYGLALEVLMLTPSTAAAPN